MELEKLHTYLLNFFNTNWNCNTFCFFMQHYTLGLEAARYAKEILQMQDKKIIPVTCQKMCNP